MRDEIKMLFKVTGPDVEQDSLVIDRRGLRVGRTRDNNLTLEHREISRQHLRILWHDDKYFVEDLNSSNGTWLNDERLPARQERELRVGDVIRLGPFLMTFVRFILPVAEAATPDAPLALMGDSDRPTNGVLIDPFPPGIPRDKSNWMKYLPAIYDEDEFTGRYLLIFESLMAPIIWYIDHFDFFLDPNLAPTEWLQWIAGWFDLLLVPQLPIERQRMIVNQVGWLFLRRGTKAGLERLLELYFGVTPLITESRSEPGHFHVRLALSDSQVDLGQDVVDRLIQSQKPAFASYSLEIV